jgi:hypothetical protein
MIHIQNENYKYLCYTNLLLIVSIIYFFFNINNNTPFFEYLLAIILIPIIITSQLFWNNPIKQSNIHKIDALVAKIVILLFIIYIIIYKFSYHFLFVLILIIVFFYFSNHYSKQEWCSTKHLCCHGILHIFCFIGTFYAFYISLPL